MLKQSNKIKTEIAEESLKISKMDKKEERIKLIKKEIEYIVNEDLALNFIQRHIKDVIIYSDYILINYDIFPQSKIEIEQINNSKRNFICL